MKSRLPSPNSFPFCRYKFRSPKRFYLKHLHYRLASADSKGTSSPLDSAVTRPPFLTSLESALTRNRGVGGGAIMVNQTCGEACLSRAVAFAFGRGISLPPGETRARPTNGNGRTSNRVDEGRLSRLLRESRGAVVFWMQAFSSS